MPLPIGRTTKKIERIERDELRGGCYKVLLMVWIVELDREGSIKREKKKEKNKMVKKEREG